MRSLKKDVGDAFNKIQFTKALEPEQTPSSQRESSPTPPLALSRNIHSEYQSTSGAPRLINIAIRLWQP
jgi:hypothetical protein